MVDETTVRIVRAAFALMSADRKTLSQEANELRDAVLAEPPPWDWRSLPREYRAGERQWDA